MTDDDLLALLHNAADAVYAAIGDLAEWGLAGTKPGQYHCDLAADAAVLDVLAAAPVGILSEESGLAHAERDVVVVVDPIDGSTNAAAGLPWFATSLCAVDRDGPRVALVVNQAVGTRFAAVRGGGATMDDRPISPSSATTLSDSLVALSGMPARGWLGWRQYRALGAAALDMCAVAAGMIDAYLDCTPLPAHGAWDYLGGMLICQEAGAVVTDRYGADLVVLEHDARRTPVAAATPQLLAECIETLNK